MNPREELVDILKKITMQDVADKVGVSKVTVSKAIRGSTEISEVMRQRILEASQELGYKYTTEGRSLSESNSRSICIITADRYFGHADYFYIDLYRLLANQLELLNYTAILHILDHKSEKEISVPGMIVENKIDGIIILGQLGRSYLNNILRFKLPTVFLDFYCDKCDPDIDSVVTDNFFGAYEITNLLIAEGHKNIGYVGNVTLTSSIQDRFLGYYKSLLEYKLEYRNDWIIKDRNDDSEWIELELPKVLPTAFVCNCDKTASLLIEKLKSSGYNIPEDCSVVGFDDSIHSTTSIPPITTVRVNIEEMAKITAKIIAKKVKSKDKHYGRVMIKGTPVIRYSMSPPR
jgi:LacI family transcriptional regulator